MHANVFARRNCRSHLTDSDYGCLIRGARGGDLSSAEMVTTSGRTSRSELIEADTSVTSSAWFMATAEAAIRLTRLAINWDSCGAKAIQQSSVEFALRSLAQFLNKDTAAPTVVPTVEGGLQTEWHMGGLDIEIEFSPLRVPFIILEDLRDGTEWQGELSGSLDRLRPYLTRIKQS